jgi:general secretion pathway protein A
MYCDFFGFSEKPFTITPNPRYIYLSSNHREAFVRLLYGIDNSLGFIVMTGEVGTGKTTVLRTLLTKLDPERYSSALIFNPCVSFEQLLENICREFDILGTAPKNCGHLELLNSFLNDQHAAGRVVVLVIDEAQNLAPEVLEQLRMISNLETEQEKLIQIVLAGQPELNDVLARNDLRQLNQRVAVRYSLTPMNFRDAADYISHRLKISGCRLPQLFSPAAVKKIYRFSHGIPRLINIACEQALVLAWTRESQVITSAIVGKVVREVGPRDRGLLRRLLIWLLGGTG